MTHIEEGTIAELFQKLERGAIPPNVKAKIVWEDDEAEEETHADSLEELLESIRKEYRINRTATMERLALLKAGQERTLALFEQWRQEDAQMTPEERAQEAQMYAEIERDGYPRFNIPDRLSGENL